jgi:hypothetical protein
MPTIHLGVYLTSGKETYQAVRWALEVCFSCSWHTPLVAPILMQLGRISGVKSLHILIIARPLTMALQGRLSSDVPQ